MEQEDPRKAAPDAHGDAPNPFDAEGETGQRRSGEYRYVYHEVARITTVRKSIPARPPVTSDAESRESPGGGTDVKRGKTP